MSESLIMGAGCGKCGATWLQDIKEPLNHECPPSEIELRLSKIEKVIRRKGSMKRKGKIPVHVYLCPVPLKIGKNGIPEGEKLAEVEKISASDPWRTNSKLIADKRLCLYDPKVKRVILMYEHDDWGRLERV